ncbi:two-component system regulatory protein YycI [Alkalicoccus urumqiensis]|nr:two-component system regulatory protein YycI [Alkalicoccus urumqiensis]
MDWSRTKTIFIITFMLLNIFLGYQLTLKQQHGDLPELASVNLESRLSEEIDININNEEVEEEGGMISGEWRVFEEVFLNQSLEEQNLSVSDDGLEIRSELESPYSLVTANIQASADAFLQEFVFRGEEYEVAAYDEEEGRVGLYQTYEGSKIDEYEREAFHLELELNDSGEIVQYTQRYLTITATGEEQELLTPLEVIDILLQENQVLVGGEREVSAAELGYYNLLEIDTDFQIFAPVWRITVDDDTYFVDALRGEIQTSMSN